jgi:uncharacterized protein (TIGR02266 family)
VAQRLSVVRSELEAPADAELDRAEQELRQHEQQLAGEVARLDSAAGGLLGRLQQLRAAVSQTRLEELGDRSAAELQRRVQLAGLPQLRSEEIRQRAIQARRLAVEARARAVEELHQAAQVHAAQLSALASQLNADEAEMGRYERAALERANAARAAERVPAPKAQPMGLRPPGLSPVSVPAPAKPPVERGQGRRESARVRMQAAIDFEGDSNFYTGFSTNISEGGIFIATVAYLEHGTPVDLSFSLPSGQKISVHGVVRWTREVNDQTPEIFPGIGVQFSELTAEAAAAIKQFVAAREPLFYPD